MPADDAAADWLVDTFAPSAQHWPALGAGQLDELRGALQLLHSHAPFGAEGAPALAGGSQQLQQLARSGIPDVRWTACCLLGATAPPHPKAPPSAVGLGAAGVRSPTEAVMASAFPMGNLKW